MSQTLKQTLLKYIRGGGVDLLFMSAPLVGLISKLLSNKMYEKLGTAMGYTYNCENGKKTLFPYTEFSVLPNNSNTH